MDIKSTTLIGIAAMTAGLISPPALAVPCVSGTLDTIVGTSCDIGDKTFNFTGFVGENIESSRLFMTVNSSDPLAPGFNLSGRDGPVFFSGSGDRLLAQLEFTFSTISGGPTIIGTTVTLNDPMTVGSGSNIVDAFDFIANGANSAVVGGGFLPEVCIDSAPIGGSACVAPPFPTTLSATGFFSSPVSTTTFGQVGFSLLPNGGSSEFNSADYSFNQNALLVPEPSILALLGLGLVVMGRSGKRRK